MAPHDTPFSTLFRLATAVDAVSALVGPDLGGGHRVRACLAGTPAEPEARP